MLRATPCVLYGSGPCFLLSLGQVCISQGTGIPVSWLSGPSHMACYHALLQLRTAMFFIRAGYVSLEAKAIPIWMWLVALSRT